MTTCHLRSGYQGYRGPVQPLSHLTFISPLDEGQGGLIPISQMWNCQPSSIMGTTLSSLSVSYHLSGRNLAQ